MFPFGQTTCFGPVLNPEFNREIKEQNNVSGTHAHVNSPPAIGICFPSSSGVESSGKAQTHNGNPRGDGRVRSQLPPRNRPRITNQELQEISRHPITAITPLFEKTLSASDAGRIWRLVLPKKGAGMPVNVMHVNFETCRNYLCTTYCRCSTTG